MPSDDEVAARPDSEHLVVSVSRARDEPEYVLMISRPADGVVHVREWSPANWAHEPREEDLPVDAVYARLERAERQRRRISLEMPRVRAWLDGRTR